MSLEVALERINKIKKSNAVELDLSKLGLTELPLELSTLTQLKILYLGGNLLTDIKGLENLNHLTSHLLVGNQITDIKGLDKLTHLTTLYLGDNQLTEIYNTSISLDHFPCFLS